MKDFKALLRLFIGKEYVLTTNVLFIDFTGSHEGGLFLQQLIYWQNICGEGKYFAKSYDEWFTELRIKKRSLMTLKSKFENSGFIQTKVQKFAGTPTLHWKIDLEKVYEMLFLYIPNIQKGTIESAATTLSESAATTLSEVSKKHFPIHRIHSENTTKNKEREEKKTRTAKNEKKENEDLPSYVIHNNYRNPEGFAKIKEFAKGEVLQSLGQQVYKHCGINYTEHQLSSWIDFTIDTIKNVNIEKCQFTTRGEIICTDLAQHITNIALKQCREDKKLRLPVRTEAKPQPQQADIKDRFWD